jgi:transcription antitermination protein NusB
LKRRIAREKAIQSLFQVDRSEIEPKDAIEHVLEDGEHADSFLESLVFGTVEHLEEIDTKIKENLEKWSFDRLGNVDRAVLRMAVYEMLYEEEIPVKVTFNEAIDLAKVFGGEESGKFVNAILSKVAQSL